MEEYLAAAKLYWIGNREIISTAVVLHLVVVYVVYRWIEQESGGKIPPADRVALFWVLGIFAVPIVFGAAVAGIILILIKFFSFVYSL